jgi:probable HAF family extracellular repeat protein
MKRFTLFQWVAKGADTITKSSRSILPLVSTAGLVAAVLFGGVASTASAAASLTPLGGLNAGGIFSGAFGVSGDGSVVVGDTNNSFLLGEAFRWSSAGGMVGLGMPSVHSSNARGVSGDGSVVVGQGGFPRPVYGGVRGEAFRWTSGGGMVALGILPGGYESIAEDVSDNGSVVVGWNNTSATSIASEAFRWTSAGGMVGLGGLHAGDRSEALGVSADGSIIVGLSRDDNFSVGEAFRWTSGGGMVGLGHLPGGLYSAAGDISDDGSVIVGFSGSASGDQPFRWTSAAGMVRLGTLPGGVRGQALGVSGDGSVVVGQSSNGPSSEAFRWTADGGMRALWDVLLSHGINSAADGWTSLGSAKAISADGNTIVGDGIRNGNSEAFVAVIPTIVPEPAGGVLALLSVSSILLVRRRSLGRPSKFSL